MTRGKAGNYWGRISERPFEAIAVVLTSGSSYTIPYGATTVTAWAIGSGSENSGFRGGAGGTSKKSWTVDAETISYSVGQSPGSNSTVTYGGVTITGNGGSGFSGGSYSGGDTGANGGNGTQVDGVEVGGAVGGNSAAVLTCYRRPATDVAGLFDALDLAGVSYADSCGAGAGAFGAGASFQFPTYDYNAGLGGGACKSSQAATGAVVLRFD